MNGKAPLQPDSLSLAAARRMQLKREPWFEPDCRSEGTLERGSGFTRL